MIQGVSRSVIACMSALGLAGLVSIEATGPYFRGRGGFTFALKARHRKMVEDRTVTQQSSDLAALIIAVADRRDTSAFAELFRYFAPRIKSLLLRMGTPSELAEELAQEAMLTVWRKAHLFDPNGASASGWVFRIARNLRIDAARRSQRIERLGRELGSEESDVEEPDAIVGAVQIEQKVRAAIAQLSADQLKVITLSFFESRPHAEIAEILQLPLGTVKSRIRLAFKRLRTLLDEVA